VASTEVGRVRQLVFPVKAWGLQCRHRMISHENPAVESADALRANSQWWWVMLQISGPIADTAATRYRTISGRHSPTSAATEITPSMMGLRKYGIYPLA